MDHCRICLNSETDKDIYYIQPDKSMDTENFVEVILFCLDIQITENSNLSTKLCMKCYKKIVAFYKFKDLALKNDTYLKSLNPDCTNEILSHNGIKIKLENLAVTDNEEFELKKEEQPQEFDSDNELLSVIKTIKYEFVEDETKQNGVKKSRGRPKIRNVETLSSNGLKCICEECGKSVKNLKEHMQRHLPADKQKRIQCDRCDKTFSCYSARYKHVKRKHLCIKHRCEICNKMVTNLKQHIMVVHNSEDLPFQCIACQRRFISKSRLDQHMTIHTKDRPYQCKQCSKRFRTKTTVLLHERQVHDKEKSHLCQFCSKRFFKKYHLQVHLRSHTKEKPYQCPDCSKSFSSTTILKNHRMIHNDMKTFNCTLCHMSFVTSRYLKCHMISHIKEKRYPCQYCGVKFHRSDHRKRHEYTAHQRHLSSKTDT